MNRRTFLKALAAAQAAALLRPPHADAALPKAKITRVRIYRPPNLNPLFNQSNMVVTVETDIGITGIGDGGAKDTLEQCAGTLIGKNPFQIEAIWQEAYIAWFYPPGREKTHALGALDAALWDIKGKALNVPVHELLGGTTRDYCECYLTGGAPPGTSPTAKLSLRERARDHRGGLPRVPDGSRRRSHRGRLRHALDRATHRAGVPRGARGSRTRRELVHRLPSALRPR
jgi:galactonate dehydratase